MRDAFREIRFAGRRLSRHRSLLFVVVGTLALGIGATTAVFSVVSAVLIRPLPYPDPDRLMALWSTHVAQGMGEARVSYPDFEDWRRSTTPFEDLAAFWAFPNTDVNLTGGLEPERVPVARVTAGFFDVIGVRPVLGRAFLPEENVVGRHRVAILSHALWQRRFASDPELVGQPLLVNGFPYTVVGILPEDFRPPETLAFGESVDLWRPLAPDDDQTGGRASRDLRVIGRLRAGVPLAQARQELQLTARRLAEEYPGTNAGWGAVVVPLREQVARQVRPVLSVLLAAVIAVLLVACTNIAGMLTADASGRRRELAVYRALGATRGRIMRRLMAESLFLAGFGGVAGVLLAFGGVELLSRLGQSGIPRLDAVTIDTPVLVFALATVVTTSLLFGLAPAYAAASVEPANGLGGTSPGYGRPRGRRFRHGLVVGELTLTFVLLVAAGLLVRSLQALLAVDPGFDAGRLLTFQLELPMATRYPEQQQRTRFFQELLAGLEALPGVRGATTADSAPFGERDTRLADAFTVVGEPNDPAAAAAAFQRVGPDYFETLGIPVLEGRAFTNRDGRDAPSVAIVNETAARRWPGNRAVGRRLRLAWEIDAEVVGIVRDVRIDGLDVNLPPIVYLPGEQLLYNFATVFVRTVGDPRSVVPVVGAIVRDLDPDQPIHHVRTIDQLIAGSVAERRVQAWLVTGFAGLALALALVGVYGVMSYTVEQRRAEIGVRIALGADPSRVVRGVLWDGARLAVWAAVLGTALALPVGRALSVALFGVGPADPWTFLGAATIVLTVSIVAAQRPAQRAATIDPTEALRRE